MILAGYFNSPTPSEIPADLILPFRVFVAKYNISAAVPQAGRGGYDERAVCRLLAHPLSGFSLARRRMSLLFRGMIMSFMSGLVV